MGSLNKVMLIGNLGTEVELKAFGSSKKAFFRMATNEVWKDKTGEKQERVTWHNVIAWDYLAEMCSKYLSKGRMVFVEGKLSNRNYTDKDGNERYVTEIVASTVEFLDKNGKSEQSSSFDFQPDFDPNFEPALENG